MALTGLAAYKYLPKTNCAECGYSTCLAFGMALAAGKTDPQKCPYAKEELSKLYEESFTSPVKEVIFGTGVSKTAIGGEKVMYRHEESFYNKTVIAALLNPQEDEFAENLEKIEETYFERAGSKLFTDSIALKSNLAKELINAASFVPETKSLIIICEDVLEIKKALTNLKERKPLFYCSKASEAQIREICKEYSIPAIVRYSEFTKNPDAFADCSIVVKLEGSYKEQLRTSLTMRAQAVYSRKSTPPTIAFLDEVCDKDMEILHACSFINRFAGALIVTTKEKNKLLPLLTLRQNLYTDPRKPIRVEPGIYSYNNPSDNSPILITTNFSLTHFLVSGETEASRIPAWVLAVDTEGTSLLTAWASDKFNAEKIKAALEKNNPQKEKKGPLVISSYVSGLQEDIEKAAERKVLIGPADASGISPWLKRSFWLNG